MSKTKIDAVIQKLDRIELFLTEQQFQLPNSEQTKWGELHLAIMSVKERRRELENG